MKKMPRRLFLETTAAVAAVGAFGQYFLSRYTEPRAGGIIGTPVGGIKGIPVVSDVDAHSQCRMRVKVEGGKVASPRGSIQCKARVTERIDPRVVHLYHGFKESNCNVLTDHKAFDPITGSVSMKSLLCKIVKV